MVIVPYNRRQMNEGQGQEQARLQEGATAGEARTAILQNDGSANSRSAGSNNDSENISRDSNGSTGNSVHLAGAQNSRQAQRAGKERRQKLVRNQRKGLPRQVVMPA
jgi:hypothetical protein